MKGEVKNNLVFGKHKEKITTTNTNGFTVRELLFVVAIAMMIGIIIYTGLKDIRPKKRDIEREQEIQQIKNALGIYVVNNGTYPIYSGPLMGSDVVSETLLVEKTINAMPLDPINTQHYQYFYESETGATYTITYYLETNTVNGKNAGKQTTNP